MPRPRPLLLASLLVLGALLGALPGAASGRPLTSARWLRGVQLTQYWPAPESWFHGALVAAPGLSGRHRVDWLYSAQGLSMQGDGVGLDGQHYHIAALGTEGWVDTAGHRVKISRHGFAAVPFWRNGGFWSGPGGAVTFPLDGGGWSAGPGRRYHPLPGVNFAPGPSLPLTSWVSVAVDPSLVPLGSWVYLPAYPSSPDHGWFYAQDTGGAIRGHHFDLYRDPPASPSDPGQTLAAQQAYVLPPGAHMSRVRGIPAPPASPPPGATPAAPLTGGIATP